MTFIVPVSATILEESMSRKLSLATLALGAMLLAVPVVAQQPDSAKTTTTMAKHHAKKHKAGKHTMAKPAAKDSTKK